MSSKMLFHVHTKSKQRRRQNHHQLNKVIQGPSLANNTGSYYAAMRRHQTSTNAFMRRIFQVSSAIPDLVNECPYQSTTRHVASRAPTQRSSNRPPIMHTNHTLSSGQLRTKHRPNHGHLQRRQTTRPPSRGRRQPFHRVTIITRPRPRP